MDLISCKVDAADISKKNGKTVYIVVDEDGECTLENAPLKGVIAKYKNGQEVPMGDADETADQVEVLKAKGKEDKKQKAKEVRAAASEKAANKTKNKMAEVKEKSKVAKKAVKKVAKKATTKTVKAAAKEFPVQKGTKKTMTVKEIMAGIKKGLKYFNEQNKPLPSGYVAKMVDQTRELKVTEVKVAAE